jgi:hypothetical protein
MNEAISEQDPLGVLAATRTVVETARHVAINQAAVERVADEIAGLAAAEPGWTDALHFRDGTWRTAGWVMALDALNFCFWSESPDPGDRWKVTWHGQTHDGYWALAAALRRAVEEGVELWSPAVLASLTDDEVAHLLRPSRPEWPQIPLLPERGANLRELGRGLLAFSTEPDAAALFIASCDGSAIRLVERVVAAFPSFNDVATLDGRAVKFFKRAQILAADLHGAFAGEGLGRFHDLDRLTVFADYKAPQVLRGLGVLRYDDRLASIVDRRELIPAGAREENEIRAATVWACELIRAAQAAQGGTLAAYEIDWALWHAGQSLAPDIPPYHRTLTIFY